MQTNTSDKFRRSVPMKIYSGCPVKFLEKFGKLGPKPTISWMNSSTRVRRSKVRIRRTRVEHNKPISRVRKNIKEVGIEPNVVFIATNLRLIGRILDRECGYSQKFVSPEVVPYTDGIAVSSTLQLSQDIPPKYFTAISYEGICRFFRANLFGLKADRDKKGNRY